MLLRILGVLLALCMIALTMMLCRRAMRLSGIIMMFGGLVVLFACHSTVPYFRSQRQPNHPPVIRSRGLIRCVKNIFEQIRQNSTNIRVQEDQNEQSYAADPARESK